MKDSKFISPSGFGHNNDLHPPQPIEDKPSKIDVFLSVAGFLCVVILIIGGFVAVWGAPWSTLVKVIITAAAILFMIIVRKESKERRKHVKEMERRAEERKRGRKPFAERVEELRKEKES